MAIEKEAQLINSWLGIEKEKRQKFPHLHVGCALDVLKSLTSSYLFPPPSWTKADQPALSSYTLGEEFKI